MREVKIRYHGTSSDIAHWHSRTFAHLGRVIGTSEKHAQSIGSHRDHESPRTALGVSTKNLSEI